MTKEIRMTNDDGGIVQKFRHLGFVILSSCGLRHSSLLLAVLFAVAPLTAAEPIAPPRHATPQAAFDAFRAATEKNDLPTALRSCATRLQNHLLVSNLKFGYRIGEQVPKYKVTLEAALRRHVPQLDLWKDELIAKAEAEGRKPLVVDLAAKIRDGAADKPALLADLMTWLADIGIDHGLPADALVAAELRKLTIDGGTAKGVAVTGDELGEVEFPVQFILEQDGWRLMLPEL